MEIWLSETKSRKLNHGNTFDVKGEGTGNSLETFKREETNADISCVWDRHRGATHTAFIFRLLSLSFPFSFSFPYSLLLSILLSLWLLFDSTLSTKSRSDSWNPFPSESCSLIETIYTVLRGVYCGEIMCGEILVESLS